MGYFNSFLQLAGRLLLGVIFLVSGIHKFQDTESVAKYMAAEGMTMVPFFLYSAALLEIVASLALMIGWKTRWAALALVLFMIPTTLLFHHFWNVEGAMQFIQKAMFFKNLAIIGGLLTVVAVGAGCFSLDACCCKKNCDTKP